MKILTYNVNGIRAAMNKGLADFLKIQNPDIVCLQEIKATPDVVDVSAFEQLGYHLHWYPAQKKGYSGVALFSKIKPDNLIYGCGHEMFDHEGRVLRADFGDLSVFSCYFPSGTTGDVRQEVKMQFLEYFFNYIDSLKKDRQKIVVCGDYNICHQAIDIHDPVGNKKSSGFLPEERDWMSKWFSSGFMDTFRHLNTEPHHYTWWSLRANARNNNKGWRIDYISISENLKDMLEEATILPNDKHSDHCSMYIKIR